MIVFDKFIFCMLMTEWLVNVTSRSTSLAEITLSSSLNVIYAFNFVGTGIMYLINIVLLRSYYDLFILVQISMGKIASDKFIAINH